MALDSLFNLASPAGGAAPSFAWWERPRPAGSWPSFRRRKQSVARIRHGLLRGLCLGSPAPADDPLDRPWGGSWE